MSQEFIFPDLGEGITEGELVKWLVNVGDSVKEDQDVAEVETDKALVTIPSPYSGKVASLNFNEGDSVPVGAVLMTFDGGSPATSAPQSPSSEEKTTEASPPVKPSAQTAQTPANNQSSLPPLATPFTRKIARELGVDLNQVSGTGEHGRITEEDVRNFAESPSPRPSPLKGEGESTSLSPGERGSGRGGPTAEAMEKYGPVERVPIKGVRRKISEAMLTSHQQTVMVTHMDEAVVDVLVKIRKKKAEFAKTKGVKLTLLPFLAKACFIALKDHPYLNASLVGKELILKKHYHFGFAVDTEAGLMVPVIRDVDKKSILALAAELTELSGKARDRKISVEELQGHTFSITNIGSIGGKAFTPIIHYPDSAILGVGRTYEKPIVKEGKIVAANVLPLCLTFDHRVTDGATAARFVNQVIQYLQDPDLLLLEDGEE